jgi:predicted  nucleic acid-binding Zn-ribbon protein
MASTSNTSKRSSQKRHNSASELIISGSGSGNNNQNDKFSLSQPVQSTASKRRCKRSHDGLGSSSQQLPDVSIESTDLINSLAATNASVRDSDAHLEIQRLKEQITSLSRTVLSQEQTVQDLTCKFDTILAIFGVIEQDISVAVTNCDHNNAEAAEAPTPTPTYSDEISKGQTQIWRAFQHAV